MTRDDQTSCVLVVAFTDGRCLLLSTRFAAHGESLAQAQPVHLSTFAAPEFPSDPARPSMLCFASVPDSCLLSERVTCCDLSGCLLALGYSSGLLNVLVLPSGDSPVAAAQSRLPAPVRTVAVAFPRVAAIAGQQPECVSVVRVSQEGSQLDVHPAGDALVAPLNTRLLLLSRRGAASSLVAVAQCRDTGALHVASDSLRRFERVPGTESLPEFAQGGFAGACSVTLTGRSCCVRVDVPSGTTQVLQIICQSGTRAFGDDLASLLTKAHIAAPHSKQQMYRLCVEHQLLGPLVSLLSSGGVYPPDASTLRVWTRSYFAEKKAELNRFYNEALTTALVDASAKVSRMKKNLAALGSLFYVYECLAGIPQTEPRLLEDLSREGNAVLCEAQRLELLLYFLDAGRLPFESDVFRRPAPEQFNLSDYLYAPLFSGQVLGVADGCRRYPPASLRELLEGVATCTQLIAQHKHAVVLYVLFDTCAPEFIQKFCSFFSVLPDWQRKIEACWLLDNHKDVDRAAALLCECDVDPFLASLAQELPRKFLATDSPLQALHVAQHLGQTVERRLMVEVLSANQLFFEAAMLLSDADLADQIHFFRGLENLKDIGTSFPLNTQMESAWIQVARERKRQDWIVLYLLHRDRVEEAIQLWKNESNALQITDNQYQLIELMLQQRGQLAQLIN